MYTHAAGADTGFFFFGGGGGGDRTPPPPTAVCNFLFFAC